MQPRCEVLEDIPPQLDFFDAVLPIDAEMYRNKKQKTTPESAKEALTALLPVLEAQTDWTRDAIFEACKTLAEQLEKKNGWLLFPLGIALSGKARTPARHRPCRHDGPRGDPQAREGRAGEAVTAIEHPALLTIFSQQRRVCFCGSGCKLLHTGLSWGRRAASPLAAVPVCGSGNPAGHPCRGAASPTPRGR